VQTQRFKGTLGEHGYFTIDSPCIAPVCLLQLTGWLAGWLEVCVRVRALNGWLGGSGLLGIE